MKPTLRSPGLLATSTGPGLGAIAEAASPQQRIHCSHRLRGKCACLLQTPIRPDPSPPSSIEDFLFFRYSQLTSDAPQVISTPNHNPRLVSFHANQALLKVTLIVLYLFRVL